MVAATLTFPSQTLLKNVVDPIDGTDAATKEYVDNALAGGGSSVGAAGSNTQIQYNDSGKLGASANLTFDSSLEVFTVIGNLVSSNANLGNAATANFFIGDGGLLSNVTAVGGMADFAANAGNANYANYAGNVVNASQPNITSVGSLLNLEVLGNVLIDGTTNTTGTGTGALIVDGGASVTKDLYVGGNLYTTTVISQNTQILQITDPLLYLTATNPYPYSYDIGLYSHFIGGPGNVYQHTGIVRNHVDGDWYLFSNIPEPSGGLVDLGNLNIVYDNLKLGDVLSSGNANIAGNLKTGTGTGGSITGANLVSANYFSGTLDSLSNNQPNITNVGTQLNFTSVGNVDFTGASNVLLGPVGNVFVTGGMSGQYLQTDGTGNLSWSTLGSGPLANGTSNIVIGYSDNVAVSVAGTSNVLNITSTGINVSTTITTSNITTSNLSTTNLNVTGNTLTLNGANITVSYGNAGIYNLGISNVNIGLSANVNIGSTTGNTTVRGNLVANNITTNSLALSSITSNSSPIPVTTSTIIDSFPKSLYRSAKYIITAKNDDGYQAEEILLLHDDSISFITVYGSLSTAFDDADIITVSSNIVSGNVCLYATGSNSNTEVNLISTYVTD